MRKVCVFTSSRAEYGLLRRVIQEINADQQLQLQLLVSGTHLVPEQGMTIQEIRADGLNPDECVDIQLTDDSPEGICHSMGVALAEYGKVLTRLKPDVLLFLGDRFETFCCAAAAQICTIPVAHICGGESTEGAVDEAFRHSITKMAHLHFPCSEEYWRRIVQLGEAPERVHNVGSLGVENIRHMAFVDRSELECRLGFQLDKPFFLVTFHPVTLEGGAAVRQVTELLAALEDFSGYKSILTYGNADAEGNSINKVIVRYAEAHGADCIAVPSLGNLRYLSAMRLCDVVIGNSSSGILEAPVFGVPTVNIGDRQKGRIRPASVIDCPAERMAIVDSIRKALNPGFRMSIAKMVHPCEQAGTAGRIVTHIRNARFDGILKKRFFDLPLDAVASSRHSDNMGAFSVS